MNSFTEMGMTTKWAQMQVFDTSFITCIPDELKQVISIHLSSRKQIPILLWSAFIIRIKSLTDACFLPHFQGQPLCLMAMYLTLFYAYGDRSIQWHSLFLYYVVLKLHSYIAHVIQRHSWTGFLQLKIKSISHQI